MIRVVEKLHEDPPTWKDWLHAATAAVTLAAVLVQGGRMIERMDAITKALDADAATIRTLGGDMARLQREVETGNGKDALHEERLRSLQQQLDEMRARVRGLRLGDEAMERWSVCIVEAWREYWRLRREWREAGYPPHGEPYVWLRASRLAPSWVPHVGVGLVDEQGRLVMRSFGPVDKRRLPWWRLWRVIVFRGRWQDGDAQPDRAGEP